MKLVIGFILALLALAVPTQAQVIGPGNQGGSAGSPFFVYPGTGATWVPGTGTNGIGQVGGWDVSPSANPTLTASSAYAANNVVGGLQTVSIFRNTTHPSGLLNWASVMSKGGQTTSITIWGFEKSPTSTCTDKSAFVLATADLPYLIPGFPITMALAATNSQTPTTASYGIVPPVSTINVDSALTTNLYFCATTSGTPTFATTSDLFFEYALIQD